MKQTVDAIVFYRATPVDGGDQRGAIDHGDTSGAAARGKHSMATLSLDAVRRATAEVRKESGPKIVESARRRW